MILSEQTSKDLEIMAKSFANHIGSDDPGYIEIIKNRFLKDMTTLIENEVRLKKDEILKIKNKEIQFNPVDSFNEYQQIAMTTKTYGKGLPVFYPAIQLGSEAGEVLGKISKAWRDSEGKFDEERIKGIKFELGDVLYYITAVADDLGFNLIDVANLNITKIIDRRARKVVSGDGDYR